jgi:hypothetical protein
MNSQTIDLNYIICYMPSEILYIYTLLINKFQIFAMNGLKALRMAFLNYFLIIK